MEGCCSLFHKTGSAGEAVDLEELENGVAAGSIGEDEGAVLVGCLAKCDVDGCAGGWADDLAGW